MTLRERVLGAFVGASMALIPSLLLLAFPIGRLLNELLLHGGIPSTSDPCGVFLFNALFIGAIFAAIAGIVVALVGFIQPPAGEYVKQLFVKSAIAFALIVAAGFTYDAATYAPIDHNRGYGCW